MTINATAGSAGHRFVPPRITAEGSCSPPGALIGNLQAELVHCAVLTSATASIALALAAGRWPGLRTYLDAYLPPAPTTFPVLAAQSALDADLAELIGTLRAYYDLASLARSLTKAAAQSQEREPAVDLHSLAATWQTVAAAGVRALGAIERQWPATHSAASRTARRHLAGICRGEESCIDETGRLVVPVLAERRNEVRTRVRSYVLVARGHAIHRLLVLNATARGFGAQGLAGVAPGETLQVIWKPGRLIDATVAWAANGMIGFELPQGSEDASEFIGALLDDTPVELLEL